MNEIEDQVEQRLDMRYVKHVAASVARCLRDGAPIEVAFQPGDGTRYDLVFVPVQSLRVAPAMRTSSGSGTVGWDSRCALGVSRHVGAAVVAWIDHGVVGLDLSCGGFVAEALANLYRTTVPSGAALAILFEQIAKATRA